MMKNIKFLFMLVIILLSACGKKVNSESNSEQERKDSVLITYYPGPIDTNVAIRCENIAKIQSQHPKNNYNSDFVEIIDTFIVDKNIVDKIEILAKGKKSTEHYNEDARMYVTLKRIDGTIDNICLSEKGPIAKFNGEPVILENELVYLLREYSGYYDWFDKRFEYNFVELEDSTFVK